MSPRTPWIVAAGLVLAITTAAPARAQSPWTPRFDPDRRVYVDPTLARDPQYRLGGLEQKLIDAGRPHHVFFYVVIASVADGDAVHRGTAGVATLDRVLARWQTETGFPFFDYLVMLWVSFERPNSAGSTGLVAANAGARLKGQGFTGEYFSNPNGPLITAFRRHMPSGDLQSAFLGAVQGINAELDRQRR